MWAHSGALSGRTVVPPDCCSFHPWFNAAQRGSTAPGRGLYFHVCQSSFTPACGDHKYTFMRPGEMLKEAFCPSPVWTSMAIFLIDDDGKVVKMPRRIFNLVYLGLLHLGIIPPQLHLYVMFKAIPQVFCYHGLLMRGSATRSYGHLKNTFIDSLTMTWNNYTSFATQGTYMYSVQQWPTCRCSWATAGVRTCTVCSALVFVCVPALFTSMFIARRLFYCLTGGLLLLLLFIANKCRSVEKPLRARDAVPSCL